MKSKQVTGEVLSQAAGAIGAAAAAVAVARSYN
jgi:hypothetical protein